MANEFDIIYKIATDLSGLQKGVQNTAAATAAIDAKMADLQSTVAKVGTALGAAFGTAIVAGIGALLKQTLDTANALTKLHDKTGVTVEGLQRLQIAGDEASNSIEQIASGITMMQKKLADGDSGAIGSLKQLGISLEDFRKLDGEGQFIAFSNAIRKVKDPADQVGFAMAVLGRSGAELLPTLKRGFDDIGESTSIMSRRSVEALDRLGDAMGMVSRATKNWLGDFAGGAVARVYEDWKSLQILFGDLPDLPTAPAMAVGKALGSITLGASELQTVYKNLNEDLKRNNDEMRRSEEAAKKVEAANEKFRESVVNLTSSSIGAAKGFGAFGLLMTDLSGQTAGARIDFNALTSSVNEFHDGLTVAGDEIKTVIIPAFSTLPNVTAQAGQAIKEAGDVAKTSFGEKVYNSLGDVSKILRRIPGLFAEIGAIAARTGQAIMRNLADGNIWGAVVAGVTGVAGVISKLWKDTEKQVNPVRQAFIDAAGGLGTLNLRAQDAGLTLSALLNAKNPEAYKKAIDDLNAAFKFQDDAMATLDATTKKYGFTIEQLGPALQRQEMGKQAETIYQDWTVLNAAGLATIDIAGRMAESVNAYIMRAVTMGTEVPAAMKPMLQTMVDQGLLTDSAGNKITDLNESGITFAETMSQGFQKVVDAVSKLADAISGKLGTAIAGIPTNIDVGVNLNAQWNIPDMPRENYAATGGRVTASGIQRFGAGGMVGSIARGTDTVPAWLTPGEIVLNEGQQRHVANALQSGAGGFDISALRSEQRGTNERLDQMMAAQARDRQDMPLTLARSIRDAMMSAA